MLSPQIRGFLYGTLITTSLVSVITYASGTDGVFGDYFDNIIHDAVGCGVNTAITGFDTAPANFGKQKCTTFDNIVRTVLGVGTAPSGQAVVGFDISGNPVYGDVNWHKDVSENISYTGAGNVGIGTDTPVYKLDTSGDVINDGWYRSRGDTGWYSETHDGGMYMMDSTWVRTWNAKSLWTNSFLGSNAGLTVGYGGISSPLGGAIIQGNVGIGTSAPSVRLDVAGTVKTTELCIGADCRTSWGGGGTLINMYQCPGVVSLGGGAWGYYGCQNQIQNQPTCYEIEYPNSQTFPCTYIGKMRLEP